MKKLIGFLSLTVLLLMLVFATMALADGPDNSGYGGWHHGGGMMGSWMDHDAMHAEMAAALGLSVEALDEAMLSGKTMYDLAEEQGLDSADLWSIMGTARGEALQQAVEAGYLSQAQADSMLNRMAGGAGHFAPMSYGTGPCGGYNNAAPNTDTSFGWGRGGHMSGMGFQSRWQTNLQSGLR